MHIDIDAKREAPDDYIASANLLPEKARQLIPTLRVRAVEEEEARSVRVETVQTLKELGVFRILQPRRFGGLSGDYQLFTNVLVELAQGSASVAWVVAILTENQWVLAGFPLEAQEEFWADSSALACASLTPYGEAKKVHGGYQISGRWSFASGCHHAQWAILGAREITESGVRQVVCVVPMNALTVLDDWNVMGLRATGSNTLAVDNVFVPDRFTLPFQDMKAGKTPGSLVHTEFALLRAKRQLFAAFSILTPLVGLALRAVSLYADQTKSRTSRSIKLSEQESLQLKVAESSAEADLGRLLIAHNCARNQHVSQSTLLEQEARTRRDVAYAAKLALQCVDRLYLASGGTSNFASSEMQLVFRDTRAAASHLFLSWELGARPYGQFLLGAQVEMLI